MGASDLDAKGIKRTVDCAVDDLNGFNGVVCKDPAVVVAAPIVAAVSAVAAITPSVIATFAVYSVSVPTVVAPTLAFSSLIAASAPAVLAASAYAVPTIYSSGSVVSPAGISYVSPQNVV